MKYPQTIFRNGRYDPDTATLYSILDWSHQLIRCLLQDTDSSSKCSSLLSSSRHYCPINLAVEDKTIVSFLLFRLTSGNQLPFGISSNNLPAIIDLTISKFTKLLTICQATVLRADRGTSMEL